MPESPDSPCLPLELVRRGKVRDVWALGPDRLLLVATDRISVFDCVLPTPVPGKGILLTQLSLFWFGFLGHPNHLVSASVEDLPPALAPWKTRIAGRMMIIRKALRFDLECVVRGYLTGSGLRDYLATGAVCGHPLPPGLREADRLPRPLFTPAAKNDEGHDLNVDLREAAAICGPQVLAHLQDVSLDLYRRASDHASSCGIVLADTKFEFGLIDGRICLVDEVLTPDSSRFWPARGFEAGRPQPSFDKQYVRDHVETLNWDKTPPAPSLPAHVVEQTLEKYREAWRRLTGVQEAPA